MNDKKHTPGPWRVEMNGNYMRLYMPEPGLKGDVARGYVGEANARLIAAAPDMLVELMNYCAECMGNGADRCPYYNKDGDMCRMAQDGTCDTWMTICKVTGHDPATPWEAEK